MSTPSSLPEAKKLVTEYSVVHTRFVPLHHPFSPMVYRIAACRCPHVKADLAAVYSRFPIVELRCRQKIKDTHPSDKDPTPDDLVDDPACDGLVGVSGRLREPFVRLLLDRGNLRYIPFDFESAVIMDTERELSTPAHIAHELAEAMLPLVCVYTSPFWYLLTTEICAQKDGTAVSWRDTTVPAHFIYNKYRSVLYTLIRATENSLEQTVIQKSVKRQEREGSIASSLRPVQPHETGAYQAYVDQEAKRLQRYHDGMVSVFERFSSMATARLRTTRQRLQQSDGSAADVQAKVFEYAVNIINVLEQHIMTLCNVLPALQARLCTPMRVPPPEAWYMQMLDADAANIVNVALARRDELAARPPLPANPTEKELAEWDDGKEDLFPPHVTSDTLRLVKNWGDYNRLVVTPLLRDPPPEEEIKDKK